MLPTAISLELLLSSEEFYIPCVMSRSGWVKQCLILQEMGAILDFPELYMAKLDSDLAMMTEEKCGLSVQLKYSSN